jgi:hypothetical protein
LYCGANGEESSSTEEKPPPARSASMITLSTRSGAGAAQWLAA